MGQFGRTPPLRAAPDLLARRAELLYGSKVGVFQYNQLLTVSTRTADGVVSAATVLALLGLRKAERGSA